MRKKIFRITLLLGFLTGLAALIFVLRKVDLVRVWETLAQLNGLALILPAAIALAAQPLRPLRWQAIFPPGTRPGFFLCYGTMSIGNMTNLFLPGRGGDLLRCFLLRRENPRTGATMVFGTLGLEKVLDTLVLLGVVLLSFLFLSPPQWLAKTAFFSGLALAGALLTLTLLRQRAVSFQSFVRRFFRTIRLESFGDGAALFFKRFAEGLHAMSSSRHAARVILLTFFVWVGEAAIIWSLAAALNIPLSLPQATTVLAILSLGLMVPAAPGFIGTYEFFSVSALQLFDIRPESALALTLLMHSWTFALTALRGLVWISLSRAGFRQLFGGQDNYVLNEEQSKQ